MLYDPINIALPLFGCRIASSIFLLWILSCSFLFKSGYHGKPKWRSMENLKITFEMITLFPYCMPSLNTVLEIEEQKMPLVSSWNCSLTFDEFLAFLLYFWSFGFCFPAEIFGVQFYTSSEVVWSCESYMWGGKQLILNMILLWAENGESMTWEPDPTNSTQ